MYYATSFPSVFLRRITRNAIKKVRSQKKQLDGKDTQYKNKNMNNEIDEMLKRPGLNHSLWLRVAILKLCLPDSCLDYWLAVCVHTFHLQPKKTFQQNKIFHLSFHISENLFFFLVSLLPPVFPSKTGEKGNEKMLDIT